MAKEETFRDPNKELEGRYGPEKTQGLIKDFETNRHMESFIRVIPNEERKDSEKPPLKVPTNLKEVKELLDPNNTGIITTESAKKAADALQKSISNSNFVVRNAAKRELGSASPEEAMINIEKRLGLKPESLEAAKVIQDAVVAGANQEPLVARESGKDDKVAARGNPKFIRETAEKIAAAQIRAMDTNGNLEVYPDEAKKAGPAIKNTMSMLPADVKSQLLEESEKKLQDDPNGKKTAESVSKFAGISVTPEAVMELRKAAIAGLKSANPNAAVAEQEAEEEKKSAKDGKDKKNPFGEFFTMIIALFKSLLGIEDETAVAKKDSSKGENVAKGEGEVKGQEQQTQLKPEEKTRSLEYLAKLDENIQRDIRHAGAQANGVGTVYAGKESGSSPQVQTVNANQPSASASASL